MGYKMEIYHVEDDEAIAMGVKEYLEGKNFTVKILSSIAEAKGVMLKKKPDMVLVDWNMPDGTGAVLCEWIRKRWSDLPVIFLTVKGESADVIQGFQNGADDYVVKPFELEILYSRICALLRRTQNESEKHTFFCDYIVLDSEKMTVFVADKEIVLSQPEYQLLHILMQNKGKTVTRERLLEQVWDSNGNFVNDNTLTVTMKRLREKLGMPACMKTIRSFGYRMEDTL